MLLSLLISNTADISDVSLPYIRFGTADYRVLTF